ncbi:MAG: putative quinol monooxygenase [Flammeovirgaceae bacterium]
MDTEQLVIVAHWKVKPQHLETVLEFLEELVTKSRAESGNLLYQAHQSITDPNVINLYEVYQNQTAIEVHKNATHFQELVVEKIVPLLEDRSVEIARPLFSALTF